MDRVTSTTRLEQAEPPLPVISKTRFLTEQQNDESLNPRDTYTRS